LEQACHCLNENKKGRAPTESIRMVKREHPLDPPNSLLAQNGWRVSRKLWDKWADTAYPRDQLRSHARRAASGSAGARRGENRTDMVRRLAAMARKPQRSSSTPRLVKALTDALQVCTLYGNAGLRQHGAWGAVPGSGADIGPLDSGGGLGQCRPRELTF